MSRDLTVANLIDRAAGKYGDKPFATREVPVAYRILGEGNTGETMTFREAYRATNGAAAALRDRLGVKPGDRIATVLTNVPEQGLIFTAAARIGAITVPFNFMLKASELPVAFIQLKEGETATEDELLGWCRENIAAYKAPRQVRLIDEMPLTMTLKVMKRELRRRLADEAASQGAGGPRR